MIPSNRARLKNLFLTGFSVLDVAEPLVSFDFESSAEQAGKLMKELDFDAAGIRVAGWVAGYVLRNELDEGNCGRYLRPFEKHTLLDENSSFVDVIAALEFKMEKTGRFLSEDHIYRDLTIALSCLFVFGPVFDFLIDSPKVYSYLIAAFLLFALYEITRRKSDFVIGLILGVPAFFGGLFNAATPDTPAINAVPTALLVLFLGFLVWRILKDLVDGSRISSEKIYAAVSAFLLIGLVFAGIYGFIALLDNGAFAVSDALKAELSGEMGPSEHGTFTYFSFVTMTSLGYGDLSPVSSAACTFAWIQAVVGQLYLAIVVAALVGAHIAKNKN